MKRNAVAILVISLSSLSIWLLLVSFRLIDQKMLTALTMLSVAISVYVGYNLFSSFEFTNPFFKILVIIFLLYEFITIIRGLTFSYDSIKIYIQSGHVFWPFVIPIFVFFDKKISTVALLVKWIYYVGLFFLAISVIFPILLLQRITAEDTISLATSCGFLLLISTYLANKKVNNSFLIIFISLLSVVFLARRSSTLTLLGFILSSYLLSVIYKSRTLIFRFFPILIGLVVMILFNLPKYSSMLTSKLQGRINEDSRSGLFEMFYFQMRDDMIIGKGMNGTYYYPIGGELEDEGVVFAEQDYRNLIENGYLQLLLTGGIIHIALFLLVTLPAAFIGIFKSSNQLCRACGIIILLWLLDMIVYGLPRLILHYILVWISVGVCYSSSLRNTTDEEIMEEFQKIDLL